MSRSHYADPATDTAALRTRVRQCVATATDGGADDDADPGPVRDHTLRALATEHPAVRLDDLLELGVLVDAPPATLDRPGQIDAVLDAALTHLRDWGREIDPARRG